MDQTGAEFKTNSHSEIFVTHYLNEELTFNLQ